MQLQNTSSLYRKIDFLTCITFGFWSLIQIFVFCEFGENVSEQFGKLNKAIYKCRWYSFPMDMQKMIQIILVSTQQPVNLRGYGNVECSREAFNRVSLRLFFLDFFS